MSRQETIKVRQGKLREAFLDQLKRTPTIETACHKVSVARATVYRWIRESRRFEKQVNDALVEGRTFMSDVAENQLFSLIGDKEFKAINLYLSTHNPRYGHRLELSGKLETKDAPLTSEQKALIKKALRLSSLHHDKSQASETDREDTQG